MNNQEVEELLLVWRRGELDSAGKDKLIGTLEELFRYPDDVLLDYISELKDDLQNVADTVDKIKKQAS